MAEQLPLVRQWVLIKLLSARRYGATVQELSQELGVNEKTIRRDLNVFREVGFPLDESVGEHGRKNWRIRAGNGQPDLSFSFDEALALYLGQRFLEPLAGTMLWEAIQGAFRKIKACLGQSALDYIHKMADRLNHRVIGVSDYSKKSELIDRLMQGIEDQRQTFLTYKSQQATEPVTYPVYPYGLTYFRGSLYLIAYAPDHDQVRHYKVDRIEGVDMTSFPFNRPVDFDLDEHLAGSFGVFHAAGNVRVKVRFSGTVARYVEESKWHASQQLMKHRDGSLTATFELSNTEEIARWLLSFGRHAEVLAPAKLRDEICDELRSMSSMYGVFAPQAKGHATSREGQPTKTNRGK